jgi:DNA polymerase III delta prime subunit
MANNIFNKGPTNETTSFKEETPFVLKYKPYFINEFGLNRHMEGVLKLLLEIDDLNILFYGNTSSGKTILLDAMIREYYHLAKDDPFPSENILYINNLKEQGVSYYRTEMKTFCQSKSIIRGKKKLVVIDDLDNVNEQSQQVFRNYMDRYKGNIHFISVCTNMQKVIESVQSRLHIMKLYPLTDNQIREHMNRIIEQEKIYIEDDSREYLLYICNHSIRMIVNYLEKLVILDQPITIALCKQVCLNISIQQFEQYIFALRNRQLEVAINIFYDLFYSGYSVIDILDLFFTFIKTKNDLDEMTKYKIIPSLCKYITIFHNVHEDVIELALFTNSIYPFFTDTSRPDSL